METQLRASLLEWLSADPLLSAEINTFAEESPLSAAPPWLGIVASTSIDWGCKDRAGREVRVALELTIRSDEPASGSSLVTAIDKRIDAMPAAQNGFELITSRFLRARAERRPRNLRAMLLEYRFRLLETAPA
ncbi:DUF3168 domain-containing protein [Altererythrobacter sp. ZODW24]|uniref:tail completion protein gp17 n=1 Tax=Altererythrobacter sp. ZODW24 TaxID=2185142 RepID=UPI000DF78974|nr:DUF3168 domain-containing protein [Altererythrobacter sp. ZODW24]